MKTIGGFYKLIIILGILSIFLVVIFCYLSYPKPTYEFLKLIMPGLGGAIGAIIAFFLARISFNYQIDINYENLTKSTINGFIVEIEEINESLKKIQEILVAFLQPYDVENLREKREIFGNCIKFPLENESERLKLIRDLLNNIFPKTFFLHKSLSPNFLCLDTEHFILINQFYSRLNLISEIDTRPLLKIIPDCDPISYILCLIDEINEIQNESSQILELLRKY